MKKRVLLTLGLVSLLSMVASCNNNNNNTSTGGSGAQVQSSTPKMTQSPKTGDNSPVAVWQLLAAGAACTMTAVGWMKKRKKL